MRQINRVAVLGAGVMGATIAAHLANGGLDVLMLDIVPGELTEQEKSNGLTLEDRNVRDRIAREGLQGLKKMKPAPFYLGTYAEQISIGNLEDDLALLEVGMVWVERVLFDQI